MNKKLLITLGIIIVSLIAIWLLTGGKYNTIVEKEGEVTASWADVETQYQRRLDLIPNLVNTVKGFAKQEQDVLLGITEARAKVGSIQVDPSKLTEENIERFQQVQSGLSSSLSRLLAVSERYPELKSNTNFLELQAQLEGTENRVAVARSRYNNQAKEYNVYIKKFPNNIAASMFGFDSKGLFEADQGAEKAPTVVF